MAANKSRLRDHCGNGNYRHAPSILEQGADMTDAEPCPMCGAPMTAAGAPCEKCGATLNAPIGTEKPDHADPSYWLRLRIIPAILVGMFSSAELLAQFLALTWLARDRVPVRGYVAASMTLYTISGILGLFAAWACVYRRWYVSFPATIIAFMIGNFARLNLHPRD